MFNIAQCAIAHVRGLAVLCQQATGITRERKGHGEPASVKKSSSDTTAKSTETVDQSALSGRSVTKTCEPAIGRSVGIRHFGRRRAIDS
jgi:hypothetical protein